jgi:hypothetical protein
VAVRSKARFARSNTGIVGSNPNRGMDVCVRLFYVCVVLYVGSVLATGLSPVQGVLSTVYRIKKLKSGQGPKGCREKERVWVIIAHHPPSPQLQVLPLYFWPHLSPLTVQRPSLKTRPVYMTSEHRGTPTLHSEIRESGQDKALLFPLISNRK